MIDLRLVLAVHDKGNGLGEFELRPAVQAGEGLAVQLEGSGHGQFPSVPGPASP